MHIPSILECQTKLRDLGFSPGPLDGLGGILTQGAIIRFQQARQLPTTGQFDATTLGAMFPKPDYSTGRAILGLLLSLATKGAIPMTGDQITGVLRAILTAIGGYLVGKGIVDQATATELVGAAVTIGGAVWSIYSNRPKTIIPLAAK